MVIQSLEQVFEDNPSDKDMKKKMDALNKLIDEHFKKPNAYLKKLCKFYNFDFEKIMDEYLDYYNLILRQSYSQHGEDATLPALKDMYLKEALYHSFEYMAQLINEKNQLNYRKQRAGDFGSNWWRYGVGS